MMMGLADLVPGVSGGTIALLSGIYEEFIESLNNLRPKLLNVLKEEGIPTFWNACNGSFLTSVFLGIITSIILFSSLIEYLLSKHQILLFSFFFGVLLVSIVILFKRIISLTIPSFSWLLFGATFSFFSTQLIPPSGSISPYYLFFCGFVAISAMILPGLSGAYILLVLGAYGPILSLVNQAKDALIRGEIAPLVYGKLFLFLVGIVMGLLIFSRVIRWFLKHHYAQTMALLIGLMLGALHKIWPWQIVEKWVIENKVRYLYSAVWPGNYPHSSQWEWALLFFGMGAATLWGLEIIKNRVNRL